MVLLNLSKKIVCCVKVNLERFGRFLDIHLKLTGFVGDPTLLQVEDIFRIFLHFIFTLK